MGKGGLEMSFTDIEYKGDLELHVKYGGKWLMSTKKPGVDGKDLIQAIEELSLALQRAIDKVSRGQTEKNIIPIKGEGDQDD